MEKTLNEITMEGFKGSIFTGFQQAVVRSKEFTIKNLKDKNTAIKTEEIYITLSPEKTARNRGSLSPDRWCSLLRNTQILLIKFLLIFGLLIESDYQIK